MGQERDETAGGSARSADIQHTLDGLASSILGELRAIDTKVDDLTNEIAGHQAEFASHKADFQDHKRREEEMWINAYPGGDPSAHRREHELLMFERAADARLRSALMDGQREIMSRLDNGTSIMTKLTEDQAAMKKELAENTQMTAALRTAGTTIGVLRRWIMWVGAPVGTLGALVYGIYQMYQVYMAAHGHYSP